MPPFGRLHEVSGRQLVGAMCVPFVTSMFVPASSVTVIPGVTTSSSENEVTPLCPEPKPANEKIGSVTGYGNEMVIKPRFRHIVVSSRAPFCAVYL